MCRWRYVDFDLIGSSLLSREFLFLVLELLSSRDSSIFRLHPVCKFFVGDHLVGNEILTFDHNVFFQWYRCCFTLISG